jgi:hypothetical protein
MKFFSKILQTKTLILIFLSIVYHPAFSQNDTDSKEEVININPSKSFHLGLYIGSYIANKHSASLYDGYGYNINGQRNDFANSILRNAIVNQYGGGFNGVDQIAQILNVSPQDWYFNESGMPINLRYNPTYMVGLNMRYNLENKQAISLNINGTKLSVNGKFVINTTATGTSTNPAFNNQNQQNVFTITGAEQRLYFQLGYQKYFGSNEKINFISELGLNIVMSKVERNQAFINANNNTLVIDLMSAYNLDTYNYVRAKYFVGVGVGCYGGLGINLNINPKYTIQLLYQPYYDRISLGDNPKFKFNHGIGLRVYYNLSYVSGN